MQRLLNAAGKGRTASARLVDANEHEKYFSDKRTVAGSQESISRKWTLTVRPAKRQKHRMAVTGQTKEEKNAAMVVNDVTNMDRPA